MKNLNPLYNLIAWVLLPDCTIILFMFFFQSNKYFSIINIMCRRIGSLKIFQNILYRNISQFYETISKKKEYTSKEHLDKFHKVTKYYNNKLNSIQYPQEGIESSILDPFTNVFTKTNIQLTKKQIANSEIFVQNNPTQRYIQQENQQIIYNKSSVLITSHQSNSLICFQFFFSNLFCSPDEYTRNMDTKIFHQEKPKTQWSIRLKISQQNQETVLS